MKRKKSDDLEFTKKLKGEIIGLGADLVGVAEVEPFRQARLSPPRILGQ